MDDEMEMNERIAMTLDDWIRQSPLPRIEARMLLQKAGGYSRVQLITQGAEAIPADVFVRLESLAERRLNGEPMAYIMGGRELKGVSLLEPVDTKLLCSTSTSYSYDRVACTIGIIEPIDKVYMSRA